MEVGRIALALLLACTSDEPEAVAEATTTGTGPGASTDAVPTSAGSTEESPTTMATTSFVSSGEDMQTGSTTGPGDTTDEPGKSCDLTFMDPAADPATAVDAGDAADQIPTVIGDALLRNCGCHYTDDITGYTDYISDAVPLSTHADFHAPYAGVFPAGFQGMPTYIAVEQRVTFHNPLPMPSLDCAVEGEPGTISAVDRALFAEWLAAGAPDGANFP